MWERRCHWMNLWRILRIWMMVKTSHMTFSRAFTIPSAENRSSLKCEFSAAFANCQHAICCLSQGNHCILTPVDIFLCDVLISWLPAHESLYLYRPSGHIMLFLVGFRNDVSFPVTLTIKGQPAKPFSYFQVNLKMAVWLCCKCAWYAHSHDRFVHVWAVIFLLTAILCHWCAPLKPFGLLLLLVYSFKFRSVLSPQLVIPASAELLLLFCSDTEKCNWCKSREQVVPVSVILKLHLCSWMDGRTYGATVVAAAGMPWSTVQCWGQIDSQCASPGVCMCEACRCSTATVTNDSVCLYESLVLYIYSAQPMPRIFALRLTGT